MNKKICIDKKIFEELLNISLKNCLEKGSEDNKLNNSRKSKELQIIQEDFENEFPNYSPGIVNKNIQNILENSPIKMNKKLSYLVEIVNDRKNNETMMIDWIFPSGGIYYYEHVKKHDHLHDHIHNNHVHNKHIYNHYETVGNLKKFILHPNDKLFIFDDRETNNCSADKNKHLYKFIVSDNSGESNEIVGTCSKKYICVKH